MKIAFLTDGIYPYVLGGMQKYAYNLAKYLAHLNTEIILYHFLTTESATQMEGSTLTPEEQAKITLKSFSFPKEDPFPGHYLRASRKISSIYATELRKEKGIDLILAQGFMAWDYLADPERDHRIPVAVHFHGLEVFQKAHGFVETLKQIMLSKKVSEVIKRSDYAVSLGGKLTPILEGLVTREKIIETSNGIDSDWMGEPNELNHPRKMVFIGRNERRKGLKELMQMVKMLPGEKFELHIIGPFSDQELPADRRIKNHGTLRSEDQVKGVLDAMDALVLPSWSEGMPTVILEAMSRGCVSIAYDVGAVSKMVDEHTGWLIPMADFDGFIAGIKAFLSADDEELVAMKKKAIIKVQNQFSWTSIAQDLLKKFQSIITERQQTN